MSTPKYRVYASIRDERNPMIELAKVQVREYSNPDLADRVIENLTAGNYDYKRVTAVTNALKSFYADGYDILIVYTKEFK